MCVDAMRQQSAETCDEQQWFVLETSLGSCMQDSQNSKGKAPSIVVIGPVVNFRNMLNWLSEVPKPIGKVETLADFKTKQAG